MLSQHSIVGFSHKNRWNSLGSTCGTWYGWPVMASSGGRMPVRSGRLTGAASVLLFGCCLIGRKNAWPRSCGKLLAAPFQFIFLNVRNARAFSLRDIANG